MEAHLKEEEVEEGLGAKEGEGRSKMSKRRGERRGEGARGMGKEDGLERG